MDNVITEFGLSVSEAIAAIIIVGTFLSVFLLGFIPYINYFFKGLMG